MPLFSSTGPSAATAAVAEVDERIRFHRVLHFQKALCVQDLPLALLQDLLVIFDLLSQLCRRQCSRVRNCDGLLPLTLLSFLVVASLR